ncbi:MAG: DUF4838 domain-containing protein [Phycisphaeraceae bacterium]
MRQFQSMRGWITLGVMGCLLGALAVDVRAQASSDELTLAREGEALAPIVISPEAGERVEAVAQELADYLGQMTGGEFAIERDEQPRRGIVLGTLEQFPDPALNEPLAMRDSFDGREAYAIRTDARRLRLIGATDLGASHAAFRFLETQGCRWFFPSDAWTVVPERRTLTVGVNETDRPALLSRRIWYGFGFFDQQAREDHQAWARHNRMAASLRIYAGHSWGRIMRQYQETFDEHPEYLALDEEGERGGSKFCISNDDLRELVVQYALDYFEKHPDADMVSVDPSDGGGHCVCEDCAAMGTVSDRVFGLANQVAQAVAEEYPGKMVGLYAYSHHSEPPSFELEPNVYIQLTAGFIRGRYTFDELMEIWPTKARHMGFYEYFSVYLWDWDMLPGGRGANVPYLKQRIRRYMDNGATSLDAESGNNWGLHGRGYYVANRLMWNPDADVEALLEDFYEKAFGPAAEPMRRYYERFDPGNDPLMSEHLVGLGFRDIAEAARLAEGRPDVQARLDELKQYLRYFHLRWMLQRADDEAEKKRLTLETLTHVYRTRRSYMNHWEAMRQSWTRRAAEEFDEPSWNARSQESHPWQVDEPYTAAEIEQAFQAGLEYFQPQEVTEREFSDELVAVAFEGAASARTRHQYQRGFRYLLYSIEGEPLVVSITPGTIAHYRNRPDARYKLIDAREQVIEQGRLPLDGEPHELTFDVPEAGLYYIEIADSGAGWRITAEPGRVATIPLRRDQAYRHAGHMPRLYFYVPKGTRTIDYYWKGGPHRVHGPDGEVVREVEVNGRFVRIDVPAGADGQLWSFTRMALRHLWFFNVPNYVAASGDALLLPRDVVEADGLTVRTSGLEGR